MIPIFQHGSGEPPGFILDVLNTWSVSWNLIPVHEDGEIPGRVPEGPLIFLGGLMSVKNESGYPWLSYEKDLIRQALKSGMPVLGICLGAQMIAPALGKEVVPCHNEREWVMISRSGEAGIKGPGRTLHVFQWHGECFELPGMSRLLYSGDNVKNHYVLMGYGNWAHSFIPR